MADLVKTTLTFPEELLARAKLRALEEKTTLSDLARQGLAARISRPVKAVRNTKKKDPMRFLGTFSLGIKVPYKHRSDLYDEHIKRKMGLR